MKAFFVNLTNPSGDSLIYACGKALVRSGRIGYNFHEINPRGTGRKGGMQYNGL